MATSGKSKILAISPRSTGSRSEAPALGLPTDKEITQSLSVAMMFHNLRCAFFSCSSKAKMSALSKVEMSVSAPFSEFGGCHFDEHGGDEQARTEPS
jgi:hypothetical protein